MMQEPCGRGLGQRGCLAAIYYFYQYSFRSAPSVMMPQLSRCVRAERARRGVSRGPVLLRIFTLSADCGRCSGPVGAQERSYRIGALIAGVGALLFGTGNLAAANVGRFSRAREEFSPWWERFTSQPRISRRPAPQLSSARRRCLAWQAGRPGSSSLVR